MRITVTVRQSSFLKVPSVLRLTTDPNARLTAANIPWLTSWLGVVIWFEPEIICSFGVTVPSGPTSRRTDLVADSAVESKKRAGSKYHSMRVWNASTAEQRWRLLHRQIFVIFGQFHQVFFPSARLRPWQTSRPSDRPWLTADVPWSDHLTTEGGLTAPVGSLQGTQLKDYISPWPLKLLNLNMQTP